MFGLKREDVTKIYRRLLHTNSYTTPPIDTIDITVGNREILTDVINTQNILSYKPKENYPLNVLDADRIEILKEINIVFGAIIIERHPEI